MTLLHSNIGRFRTDLQRRITAWVVENWSKPVSKSPMKPLLPCLGFTSGLYLKGLKRDQARAASERQTLPAFVVSVGNLVTGGTGKTPFTIWLARRLSEGHKHVAILSRGYGSGRKAGEAEQAPVDGETGKNISRFGDEPVLMARSLPQIPVWVGRKRFLAGRSAIRSSGAEILLLDDAFQHLALHRDLDFVLLDAEQPFGNGLLLPLGPLREPIESLSRADAIVLTRANDMEKANATRSQLEARFPGKPIFACRHRLGRFTLGLGGPQVPLDMLRGIPLAAFAGIARPQAFFDSLRDLGLTLRAAVSFPDHYPYGAADIHLLLRNARENGARLLISTEKDLVRLPEEVQSSVLAAALELDFGADREALCRFVDSRDFTSEPSRSLTSELLGSLGPEPIEAYDHLLDWERFNSDEEPS
jgi:tetraacyldisaccharide 4'-kinase